MFRRAASILVSFGLLAGPLAATPHAHAGMTAAERETHDATPHVHLHGHEAGHVYHLRHDHSHHGHRHSGAEPAPDAPVSGHAAIGRLATEHDADAVYVPTSVGSFAPLGEQHASPSLGTLIRQFDACGVLASEATARPCWHPPEAATDGSHTYLTLRTLRI